MFPKSTIFAAIDNSMSQTSKRSVSIGNSTLEQKAPETLPLLDQLMIFLTPNPKEIVDAEKRSRSVVITEIPEADPSTDFFFYTSSCH
ncbi:unnamed protein product [Nippostrongylus brasiliensis]|uniref:Ovule protein n=1 Tax=Nippostrongylus brasiliensis TaxID=27835 RepID=A0A0N4Y5U1_NIPBR|nr:unnamed protein product [Nippostrongylus brasiliensis]